LEGNLEIFVVSDVCIASEHVSKKRQEAQFFKNRILFFSFFAPKDLVERRLSGTVRMMQIFLSRPVLRISPRCLSTASSKPVRWGILSAGKISSDYAKAIATTEGAVVGAVAARSSNKAEDFANLHGIPKSYGSYAELLADPDIDVVYVGSIADYHYPLAAQSLLAGKPTVVEKPLTLSYKDTKSLVQLARNRDVFLMYVAVEMGFGLASYHSLLTCVFFSLLGKECGHGVFQP
jgi:hypothetical protein